MINKKYTDFKIYDVNDKSFCKYGRVITDIDCSDIISKMDNVVVESGVIYEPSVESLECSADMKKLKNSFFGMLDMQIGYCNGYNEYLTALEYHRSSEVNIACDDLILLLGKQQDLEEDYSYDSSNIEGFLLKKGTAVEIYATTLHYAPCSVNGHTFRCIVALPQGTNEELEGFSIITKEDKILEAQNKWLITDIK